MKRLTLKELEKQVKYYRETLSSMEIVLSLFKTEALDEKMKSLNKKSLNKKILKAVKPRKKYRRVKKHWTQLPKNRKKVLAQLKRASQIRYKKENKKDKE